MCVHMCVSAYKCVSRAFSLAFFSLVQLFCPMLICLIFIYSFILFYVCLFAKKQQKECGCRCEGPGIQGGVGGKETGIRIHERSQFSIKEKRKKKTCPNLKVCMEVTV